MRSKAIMNRLSRWLFGMLGAGVLALPPAALAEAPDLRDQQWWVRDASGAGIEAAMLHEGTWSPPDEPSKDWQKADFNDSGWLTSDKLSSGYALTSFESDRDGTLILRANGHYRGWINGTRHVGDIYQHGYVHLPVRVREGTNWLLLYSGRGRVRAELVDPPSDAALNTKDTTLPSLLTGRATDAWAALPVLNTSDQPRRDLMLRVTGPGVETTRTELPRIPAVAMRKARFRIKAPARDEPGEETIELELIEQASNGPAQILDTAKLTLERVAPSDPHRRTFISGIDGSVQYYGAREAAGQRQSPPAIVMSLHGASVEASGQANAYSRKEWTHLIAPTNRRPYGYDWEDFGRRDALEVLEIAKARYRHDAQRVYLTGHSMGGHGVWHLGSLYPDRFAALGVSAGWLQYWNYGSSRPRPEPDSPLDELRHRLYFPSDPVALGDPNLAGLGIYMLHGSEDKNVPPEQAKRMAEHLKGYHHDWRLHIAEGKDHWWHDDWEDGGTSCVDWPPMFSFFAHHARQPRSALRAVAFTTPNPGISSEHEWVRIETQHTLHELSRVDLRRWPNNGRISGSTKNVARLSLSVDAMRATPPFEVTLDGQTLKQVEPAASTGRLHLTQTADGDWQRASPASPSRKGPHRYGPIKDSLRQRFMIVYGTAGSDDADQWARDFARRLAERWWYRGNGAVDVVPDTDFDPDEARDRDVLLIGNAHTHRHWKTLLSSSPMQLTRGNLTIGDRRWAGEDLAGLMVRPRPGSDTACVVAIGGTGPVGRRQAARLSLLVPFRRYPDFVAFRAQAGSTGPERLAGGFFGLDWSLKEDAWAISEKPAATNGNATASTKPRDQALDEQ